MRTINMMIDDILPPGIRDYIAEVSEAEHPSLQALRHETEQAVPKAHMMIGPQVAQFLQFLIKISGATHCLEIGTFTGYSALCIALALPNAGTLITLEKNEKHAQIAKTHFDQHEQGKKIDLMVGDALEILPTLQKEFDFIFIDADKINYSSYFDLTLPKLKPNGVMIVDNALLHFEVMSPHSMLGRAVDTMNRIAKASKLVETQLLPIRDGMLLIRKI